MTTPQNKDAKPGTPYTRMLGNSGPLLLWRFVGLLGLAGALYGLFSIGAVGMGTVALLDGTDEATAIGAIFIVCGLPGLIVGLPAALTAVFALTRSVQAGVQLRESYIRDVASSEG